MVMLAAAGGLVGAELLLGALASLGKAVDAGFADGERLAADPAFARLRDDRRFRALLAELEGAG